ncbi:MAG: type IV secretory system conjugative DNA transfer family protein [Candidatus Zixiibacteriota bacterium]
MSGFLIGHERTTGKPVVLTREDLLLHEIICGKTGLGKSELLKAKVRFCIDHRIPVVVGDPHGDLYWDCLHYAVARGRGGDIVALDANDAVDNYAFQLNVLERNGLESSTHAGITYHAISKAFREQDDQVKPRLERRERATLVALIEGGYTLSDILHFLSLSDGRFRQHVLSKVENPFVRAEWAEFDAIARRADKEVLIESTLNRAAKFILNDPIRRVVGGAACNLDWQEIRAKGKIVLLNLQPVKVARECQVLLSMLAIDHLCNNATQQTKKENPLHVALDEADEITSPDFTYALQALRKRGVFFTLAFQNLQQLRAKDDTSRLLAGALSCCRLKVVFGCSYDDCALLAREVFPGEFRGDVVKDELYRTLLLPKESRRTIRGSSVSESEAMSESDSEASFEGTGAGFASVDGSADGQGLSYGGVTGDVLQSSELSSMSSAAAASSSAMSGSTSSHTTSTSRARGRSRTRAVVPFYEHVRTQELSSRTFSSPGEELEKRIAALQLQPQRHAIVKIGERPAVPITTAFVRPARAWQPDVERALALNAQRYGLPVADVDRLIEARHAVLPEPEHEVENCQDLESLFRPRGRSR